MLGQMAKLYFTQDSYELFEIDLRYELSNRVDFFLKIDSIQPDIILNCIGAIKQKTQSPDNLFIINALLPLDLVTYVNKKCLIIHPSTDCVFSGQLGSPYDKTRLCDAQDDYGQSKILAEVAMLKASNSIIIRTSIIGLDNQPQGKGLLNYHHI